MNFILPAIAALLQASSLTLDKVVLSLRKVTYKTYTGISFPLIFIITLVIFLIFRPPISWQLFQGTSGLLLLVAIIIAIVTNLLFYRALDYDKLGEIQTLSLLNRLPIIIFASIIFTDERNFFILIPALIAALAIIWSHWEKNHFKIAKKTLPYFIWAISVAPISAIVIKTMLLYWHPITLELVRSGIIAIIIGPLFFKYANKVSFKAFGLLVVTNILTAVAGILYYFSYQRFGIVYTVLIFSLQPLLVYFASLFFLKEKLKWKKIIAFFVVLVSIIIAQVIG